MTVAIARPTSPIRWPLRAIVAILLTVPAIVWLINLGEPLAYLSHRVPTGQILYIFSKLFALYALAFMTTQVFLGIQGRRSDLFRFHPTVGALTAIFVLLHLAAYIIAATLRSKHSALDVLIPTFNKGFLKLSVSLGVIAVYLLIAVMISGFLLLKRKRAFRFLHWLAYAVVMLGFLHSFFIGSETRQPVVAGYYAILLAAVFAALLKKIAPRLRRASMS